MYPFLFVVFFSMLISNQRATGQKLWPQPQQMATFDEYFAIDPFSFAFLIDQNSTDCKIVNEARQRYWFLIFDRRCPGDKSRTQRAGGRQGLVPYPFLPHITITFANCEEFPYEGMDESYKIMIKNGSKGSLTAISSWGIIRGLETISQMVYPTNDGIDDFFLVKHTEIIDYPRFPYRGVMIDTSRHFIPVAILKQNLDAMAYNKMNVFHWHLVDDQSFPYQSIRFPELHQQGSYNNQTHIFTQQDVQEVIEYARQRGIRVIPEFDTPGHTLSWNAIPNLLTECYDRGIRTGTFGPMNPISNSTYEFLNQFLQEIANVFPDREMHVGGDEVDFSCWESNPAVKEFMEKEGLTESYVLQQMFMDRLMKITDRLNKNHIVWQEVFDKGAALSPRSTVHVWLGNTPPEWQAKLREITAQGIRSILSSPWYLNHIKYGIDWQPFYQVEPLDFHASADQKKLVIGGSVCMWTEFVDGGEIIARTWPRASAVAERLWSSRETRQIWWAAERIQAMQCRMQQRGIRVGTIHGPNFCPCDYVFQ